MTRSHVLAREIPLAAAAISLVIGVAYFALWLLGTPVRWGVAGEITMRTNMALALALAAASLLLLQGSVRAPWRRAVAIALAALVLLVGAATAFEIVSGVDLRIDQLFASEPPGMPGVLSPNRMGPPGALGLTLLGAGLLALAGKRCAAAVWLGVATSCIVLVPAVGFLYGIGELHANPATTAIAWPTVIALLLLSLGLVLAAGERSTSLFWRDDAGGVLMRRMLPVVVLLPLGLGYLHLLGERHGLFGQGVGAGLFAAALSILSSLVLWRSARWLSRTAAARTRAEQEARWRASLIDLAHDAIMVWSPSRGIESWNRGAEDLYGYSVAEAVGRSSRELLQTVFPCPWAEIEEALARAGRWQGELLHRTKAGAQVTVSSKWQAVRGADGEMRVMESSRDISDAKRAADQLRDADRRKNEFLGMLSHELRNPLAPIRNSLYVLERAEPGGPQALRAQRVIGRQVTHLTRLIDDLLDVTRISRGKIRLQKERVELCDLVRRTAEDHRSIFSDNGLELEVRTCEATLFTDADPTRVSQVIGNLLSNAAKFTPRGGKVMLELGAEDGAAAIRVRDNGVGVDPAVLEQLFEPFVQADATLDRTRGGLGIGLALVKGLVELHGGTVCARSEGPGTGAEFTVRLPLASIEAPGPRPEGAPAAHGAA